MSLHNFGVWGPSVGTSTFPTSGGFDLSTYTLTVTPGDPNAGIYNPGSLACQLAKILNVSCDASGLVALAQAGVKFLTGGGNGNGAATPCPPGLIALPGGGGCQAVAKGTGTSVMPGKFGAAVMGAFGMAALEPAIIGEIRGNPIRRCPRGSFLGIDDLCYNKLPRKFRKWKPRPRPPVTAADAKAIRKAEGARDRVKKLAVGVGFTCKKR